MKTTFQLIGLFALWVLAFISGVYVTRLMFHASDSVAWSQSALAVKWFNEEQDKLNDDNPNSMIHHSVIKVVMAHEVYELGLRSDGVVVARPTK